MANFIKKLSISIITMLMYSTTLMGDTIEGKIVPLRMEAMLEVATSILEEERPASDLDKLPIELRDFINFLLQHRLNYNMALIDAAKFSSYYVNDLLSLGFPTIFVDIYDSLGATPLMYASLYNRPEIIGALLQAGATINQQNPYGFSALHLAAEKGNIESVAQLLADKNVIIDLTTHDGITPLMLAAANNYPEIVELLLNKDASLSLKDNNGLNAWLYAANKGSIDVIRYLLTKYKDKIDINETDTVGSSAITMAAQQGFKKLIALLLEHGANVNDNQNEGLTPLHYVAMINNPSYIPQIIELLLANGANINAQSNNNDTPLNLAIVESKSKANVETLLKYGADITLADNQGKTALDHAQELGNEAIIALLEKAAAAQGE